MRKDILCLPNLARPHEKGSDWLAAPRRYKDHEGRTAATQALLTTPSSDRKPLKKESFRSSPDSRQALKCIDSLSVLSLSLSLSGVLGLDSERRSPQSPPPSGGGCRRSPAGLLFAPEMLVRAKFWKQPRKAVPPGCLRLVRKPTSTYLPTSGRS